MGERALLMVWGVTNEDEKEEEERPSESLGLVSVDILASPTSLSQSSQQPQPLSFNKSSKKTEDLLELLLPSCFTPSFPPKFPFLS